MGLEPSTVVLTTAPGGLLPHRRAAATASPGRRLPRAAPPAGRSGADGQAVDDAWYSAELLPGLDRLDLQAS